MHIEENAVLQIFRDNWSKVRPRVRHGAVGERDGIVSALKGRAGVASSSPQRPTDGGVESRSDEGWGRGTGHGNEIRNVT